MPRYGGFLYGLDTYGERVRGDIPISIQNTGYWTNAEGRTFAKVLIDMGDNLSDYPDGSHVVVARGSAWYPDLPGKFGVVPPADAGRISNAETVIFSGTVFNGSIAGGWRTITHRDIAPIPVNSVLYLRVFVREPAVIGDDGPVDLPWDVRGSAFAVMAGLYGGRDAALNSIPLTHFTDGDPFGFIDPASPTAKFVSSLGFLADSVFTDGALLVDGPSRMHPNMVWPLLAAFGITKDERAAFADNHLFGRLKNLLFSFRRIMSSRGIAGNDRDGLGELARAVTGYDITVLPTPENLLPTLGDSMPAGNTNNCLGQHIGTGVEVRGAAWAPICTLPWISGPIPPWGDLWVDIGVPDFFDDDWSEVGDVWLDRWDQLDLPEGVDPPPPVIAASLSDTWYSEDYTLHTDWVHKMTGAGTIGTRTGGGGNPDPAVCEHVDVGAQSYRLRFRVYGSGTFTPTLIFMSETGDVTAFDGDPVVAANAWADVEVTAEVPEEPGWIAWRASKTGAGTGFIGAIELRALTADLTEDPYLPSAWLIPYRNPRSVVVAVHTQWVATGEVAAGMDDEDATVDDPAVLMNQRSGESTGALIANDVVSVFKLREIMPDYLPHSVTARVIASWQPEYQYRFADRNPAAAG